MTPEKLEKWGKNWQQYLHEMDKNLTITQLEDDYGAGAKVFHTHYKLSGLLGLVVSDRSFYTASWDEEDETSHTNISTTEGLESIVEANKSRTGKDELGTVHVEYFKIMFGTEDGKIRFLKVKQAHAGGKLPRGENVKTKDIIKNTRREIENMIEFMANKIK